MTHAGFFEGIGGFSVAAEMAGFETKLTCEIDPFCNKILKHYWPHAQKYQDITKADFSIWKHRIGVLTGGFPCQGFSIAGARRGTEDDRYLWPEMLRGIDQIRPPWIIGENVTGILSMEDESGVWKEVFAKVENRQIVRYEAVDIYDALYVRQSKMLVNQICESLEKRGYEVQTFAIPACGVGAPHRRERIWFIAHSSANGLLATQNRQSLEPRNNRNQTGPQQAGEPQRRSNQTAGIVANAKTAGTTQEAKGGKRENGKHEPERGEVRGGPGTNAKSRPITNATSKQSERLQPEQYNIGEQKQGEFRGTYSPNNNGNATHANGFRLRPEGNGFRKSRFIGEDGTGNYWSNFPTQSPVCGGDDGLSAKLDGITVSKHRTESLKGFGNAVVPMVPLQFFKIIKEVTDF